MPHISPCVVLALPLLMATSSALPVTVSNVAIFERAQLTDTLAVTSFGIIEDSRCGTSAFCFRDDRLVVAAVVHYRGQDREVSLALGEPLRLNGGTLTLTGTATPASDRGAIQLKNYRLDFEFQPRG